jgi:hypothetical protein
MSIADRQQLTVKVPFTLENAGRCWCPDCPVQKQSDCVHDLKLTLTDTLEKSPPNRGKIPGVYCSTGTATCKDLDYAKDCQCPTCGVFDQHHLAKGKPVGRYCRDGASK